MIKAMEMQAAAERERKATVIQAEGQKQAAILQADARLESAKRDAEAQVTLANASATAIKNVMAASAGADALYVWLICSGEKYIRAIGQLSASPNAKTVVCCPAICGSGTRRDGQIWQVSRLCFFQKPISLALISGLLLMSNTAHAAHVFLIPVPVNLRGTLEQMIFRIVSRGTKIISRKTTIRPFWFIQLPKPVCIDADPNKGDLNMAEDSIDIFEMEVNQDQYEKYHDLVGNPIHITGTLFGAIGVHHHSPVVIDNH